MSKGQSKKAEWFDEYHKGVRYGLQGKVLINEKSQFQEIKIIESEKYGKCLLLDNCWMTAEHQEKQYHECLVQPAMCGANNLEKVLIIGGGDGGSARECLKHQELRQLDLIEIDYRVIDLSKKYLPSLGGDSWNDTRLNIEINDGVEWIRKAKENSYDVIIIDSSDPKGPAKGLFDKTFYENCKRILRPGGVFGTQSESPESFKRTHIDIVKLIREVFLYADPLYGPVPIYPSGWWSWTFAAHKEPKYLNPQQKRSSWVSETCEFWSPRWQSGAFDAIPACIERELLIR